MFLGGTVKPGVITAAIGFNWPRYSLIDKCCEQANGGEGGSTPGQSVYFRGECRGAVDYSTCFSNPGPCGRNL